MMQLFQNACHGRFFSLSLGLAFVAGALAHLGFAPYSLWWLPPLSLALFYLLLRGQSPRQAAWTGFGFGLGLFTLGIRWVHVSMDQFGGLPLAVSLLLMLLLCAYLALYPALAAYLFGRWRSNAWWQRPLLFAALWIITEWLRGWVLTGFPWLWLGYSLIDSPLAGAASTIGVMGLSLVLVLATALAMEYRRQRWQPALLTAALVGLTALLAHQQWITTTDKQVDVALVQGNIPQSAKWQEEQMWPTIIKYMDMSRPHLDADLVIWPEAAIPAVEPWVKDYLELIDTTANLRQSAVITGIIAREGDRLGKDYYNALLVLGNDQAKTQESGHYGTQHTNRYYKHQLLPIGEFVPLGDLLRPLAPFFNLPMSSFQRGDAQQPDLKALGHTLTPAICYEIAFPELVRKNLKADTEMLLTVSNDAWFGSSIGPHQHMEIARMRALELGRPLLRVTNNGVTAVVDGQGQITAQLPQFEEGVLRHQLTLVEGVTPFSRWGQTPWLVLAGLIVAIGWRQASRRR